MKPVVILSPLTILFLFAFALFSSAVFAFQPTLHTINFGGSVGNHYSPSNLVVEVGDTIVWKGDFSALNMVSTSVPAGAQSISVNSGQSFTYIVEVAGTYYTQNNIWASLGMRDTIAAVYKPHGSVTNEGREFYLGALYPTYNNVAPTTLLRNFATYALITTFYDNVINYSYYDASGMELPATKRVMTAHTLLQIPLDISSMRADSFPEQPIYKAVHITSKYPIAVQWLSRGANSGGSYLALPTIGVGKNYVVASYNDDAGNGALYNRNGLPKNYDVAGGDFMIIATENTTTVNIIPAATTSTGKFKGAPFSTGLSKGQCYFVRTDGLSADHDISGSIITANKPIIVLSGHEDAYIGDVAGSSTEARDFMIEQLLPVEYWDVQGYIGIPFVTSSGTAGGGVGDGYRTYTFDNTQAKIQADVVGIAGGYDMSTNRLGYAEHYDITSPVDIYSTNSQKIAVMQYDERSQPTKSPYPAPSMMTIIPHSRWRTAYNFSEFDPSGIAGVNPNQFIGIISDSLTQIRVSANGSAESNLPGNGITSAGTTYSSISKIFTSAKGSRYNIASSSYYLHSDYPFMVYTYGMSTLNLNLGFGGNYDFDYEYAAPAGTQLNTGVPPSFKVDVTTLPNCEGWNVCVTDTSNTNPGLKAVMLVDDTAGVYFQRPGTKFSNVSFDSSSSDFISGELHLDPDLHPGTQQYCFHININNRLAEAVAPVGLIDRNNNGLLIRLFRSAPTVALSTSPNASPKPDSIFFPQQKVGDQICTTFVVKNTAPVGGSPLLFTSAQLSHVSQVFSIQSVTPTLPAQIDPQNSLTVQLCYTSKDSLKHLDTLVISNDCFDIPISLEAHSATGLIAADDITNYPAIDTGTQNCKTLFIRNIGSAPYNLIASPRLTNTKDFSIDPAFLASLPKPIPPGGKLSVSVCFHPVLPGSYDDTIYWATDIDAAFANSGKNYSVLEGTGLKVDVGVVRTGDGSTNALSIHPNPASGNSAFVSFSLPTKAKATLAIFDVLGRELSHMNFSSGTSDFELPIGFLKQGLYYVRLTSDDVVLTRKLEIVK